MTTHSLTTKDIYSNKWRGRTDVHSRKLQDDHTQERSFVQHT
jgi:hypothetical protein